MKTPLVAIVTVTYNAEAVIDDFMASLAAQTLADWRLVVVDNASTDATLAALERWRVDPRVDLVSLPTNTGAAEGNNVGLRRAMALGAPHVLLSNNDVTFPPPTLRRFLDEKRALPAGAVSATLLYDEPQRRIWFNGGRIERKLGVRCVHREVHGSGEEVAAAYATEYAPTTFLLLDSVLVERMGEMDAAYFAYWEDADYVWRARQAGYGVWVSPTVEVIHKVSASSGGSGSLFSNQQYHKNQMLFAWKHFGAAMTAYTALFSILRIVSRRMLGRDQNALSRAKMRGLWQGLRGLPRVADNRMRQR